MKLRISLLLVILVASSTVMLALLNAGCPTSPTATRTIANHAAPNNASPGLQMRAAVKPPSTPP